MADSKWSEWKEKYMKKEYKSDKNISRISSETFQKSLTNLTKKSLMANET